MRITFITTQCDNLRNRRMASVVCSRSLVPGSFHKPEDTQCWVSCTCIAECWSNSVSLTCLLAAYFQGLGLYAVAQSPHHTAATPALSDEVFQQIPSILGLTSTPANLLWYFATPDIGVTDWSSQMNTWPAAQISHFPREGVWIGWECRKDDGRESGHDENVEALSYRAMWLWGET